MSESPTLLNSDILLSILSLSTTKTATSIMETCRFLYHEGAKVVLQQPVILDGLHSEEKILSLLRFLQAEDLSRCSYVRALHVLTDPLSDSAAKVLVDIVPRMSNLVLLRLKGEQSLVAYPDLRSVFASLRSLKVLWMMEVGAQSCEMIRALQSELVTASIQFNPTGQFGPGLEPSQSFIASRHPLQLLQRSASTLQELMCGFWCDAYTQVEEMFALPQSIYPEVRTLILCNATPPSPIAYLNALPNVTHLAVERCRTIIGDYVLLGMAHAQRQVNLMLQNLTLNYDPDMLVWKNIQTYVGPLSDLWALGITFPIPQLTVSDVPGIRAPHALTEVVAYARPTDLGIVFEDQPLTSVLQSDFLDALRSEGAAGLRSLRVMVDLMAGDVDRTLDVGQAVASIETVVSGLQLCNLHFVLRDITPAPEPTELSALDGEPLRADARGDEHADAAPQDQPTIRAPTENLNLASFTLAERTLEAVDARDFVDRLLTSIPSLEHVMVAVGRPRRCGGMLRSACCGKNDKAEMQVYTGGEIKYKEMEETELTQKALDRGPTWASISRAWYRGAMTSVRGEEGRFAVASGADVV